MNLLDFRPKLIAEMARRFSCPRSTAEDAVDEGISRILRVELKAKNIFPLLYQICKNVMLDRKKRAEVARRNIVIITNSICRQTTPLQDSMSVELERSMKSELLSLRDRERMVFELFCIDGLSHEEVALKLGVSVATSKTIVCRVRKILRERLERFAS